MILVIGGRSKIGFALIERLRDKGESVRALVRSGEPGDSFPAGVDTVVGDLADPDSVAAALAGIERMFLLCGPAEQEVQLNRNAIDAAKQAGVRLLVRSSIIGSDPGARATFVRDHGACDSYLAQSGVPHVIVRPNLFAQNIPESTIPSIATGGTFYVNAGDARISMVDTRDVAAVAAAALTEPGHEDESYDVTGPEALSYHDVAGELSAAMGRQITYVDVPAGNVRDVLLGYGMGRWLVDALVDLYEDYRRSGTHGYASQVTDTVQAVTGNPARSLGELLAEQPAAGHA